MEALGLSKELIGLISAIGVVPTVVICGVVLFFVIRELKKGNKQLTDSITSLRKQSDQQDLEIKKEIENIKNELKFTQSNSMSKEDHYRDVAGWKSSIDNLSQIVTKMPIELLKILKS